MEKILKVLRYGEFDIRFNTDIDPLKSPVVIPDLISRVSFTMATKLWGGNEQAVLAVIRSLAIADLGLAVNRKEMLRWLGSQSELVASALDHAKKDFEKDGGKVMVFGPGIMPGKMKSRKPWKESPEDASLTEASGMSIPFT